jgi:hypothetical protein
MRQTVSVTSLGVLGGLPFPASHPDQQSRILWTFCSAPRMSASIWMLSWDWAAAHSMAASGDAKEVATYVAMER